MAVAVAYLLWTVALATTALATSSAVKYLVVFLNNGLAHTVAWRKPEWVKVGLIFGKVGLGINGSGAKW